MREAQTDISELDELHNMNISLICHNAGSASKGNWVYREPELNKTKLEQFNQLFPLRWTPAEALMCTSSRTGCRKGEKPWHSFKD